VQAEALAALIEAGLLAARRGDNPPDVSAPFAACLLADPASFAEPAARVMVGFLRRSSGFAGWDGAARRARRRVPGPSAY
jgi:hypothetical protein